MVRAASRFLDRHPADPGFNPLDPEVIAGHEKDWRYLQNAQSRAEFDQMVAGLEGEWQNRARREAYDGWVAPLIGSVLSPEGLAATAFLPARIGLGAASGLKVGGIVLGTGAADEFFLRQRLDPTATVGEGVARVGINTLFAGALGAGLGVLGSRQATRLSNQLGNELAAMGGVGNFTERLKYGEAVSTVHWNAGRTPDMPEEGSPFGVYPMADGRVLVDAEQVSRGFAQKAWTGLGLPDDAFANPNEWGEFLIRFELRRGAGLDDLTPAVTGAYDDFLAWRTDNRIAMGNRLAAMLHRMADTPFKRVHRAAASQEAVDLVDKIAADAAFSTVASHAGRTVGPSIEQMVPELTTGRLSMLELAEREAWEQYLGYARNASFADMSLRRMQRTRADGSAGLSLEEFRRAAARAWITGERSGEEAVDRYADQIGRFYKQYARDLERVNVLNRRSAEGRRMVADARVARLEGMIARMQETQARRGLTAAQQARMGALVEARAAAAEEAAVLARHGASPLQAERYFTRLWSVEGLRRAPATAKRILREQMTAHPEGWVWNQGDNGRWKLEWVAFDMRPEAVSARVDKLYDELVNGRESVDAYRPGGAPAFARMRMLDFDNRDLVDVDLDAADGMGKVDLIETDPMLVAGTYAHRMGPSIADARVFDFGEGADAGFEQVLQRTLAREAEARGGKVSEPDGTVSGLKPKDVRAIEEMERDLRFLRDRSLRRVEMEPDRLDNRMVAALRDVGHLAYMGLSGLAAITDAGKLVMAHGVAGTMRTAFRLVDDDGAMAKLSKTELRQAGGLGDVALGLAVNRLSESAATGNRTWIERALRQGVNRFFILNGLAPLTYALKSFDGVARQHALIDAAVRFASNGDAEARGFLAQHGIRPALARTIAEQGGLEKHADGFYLANTESWTSEEARRAFRAALISGTDNTILLASSADKPALIDGVLHLRSNALTDRLAAKAGWTRQGAYWRLQSKLLGMPFSYWNFGLAALNKIATSTANNPSGQAIMGVGIMLGLGYFATRARFMASGQPFAWDSMSLKEKLATVIDRSGVLGVLPDVLYKAQALSVATTGVNPLPVDARGGRDPSIADAMVEIAGAPASIARNLVGGGAGMALGVEGSAEQFSWAMPGRNYPATRWFYEAAVEAAEPAPGPWLPGRN